MTILGQHLGPCEGSQTARSAIKGNHDGLVQGRADRPWRKLLVFRGMQQKQGGGSSGKDNSSDVTKEQKPTGVTTIAGQGNQLRARLLRSVGRNSLSGGYTLNVMCFHADALRLETGSQVTQVVSCPHDFTRVPVIGDVLIEVGSLVRMLCVSRAKKRAFGKTASAFVDPSRVAITCDGMRISSFLYPFSLNDLS